MGSMEKLMQSYPLDVSGGVLTSPLVRPRVQCASEIILSLLDQPECSKGAAVRIHSHPSALFAVSVHPMSVIHHERCVISSAFYPCVMILAESPAPERRTRVHTAAIGI